MNLKKSLIFVCFSLSFAVSSNNEKIIKEPLVIDKTHNLNRILKDLTFEERITLIKRELLSAGLDKVLYKNNNKIYYIPISSYLLLNGYEIEASYLVEKEYIKPFEDFQYLNTNLSDVVISMENNQSTFFNKSLNYIEDINKQFMYNGENGFTLLMLAATQKDENTYFETEKIILSGANVYLQSYNNLTAIDIANFEKNRDFIESYHNSLKMKIDESFNIEEEFLKNTPISKTEQKKQKLIVEKLKDIDLSSSEIDFLYNKLNSFILLGYNDAADLIFEELLKRDSFNINKFSDDDLNPLISSAISIVSGGNIEYFVKLVDNGADFNIIKRDNNLAEMSIYKDNYKILFLLYKKGFNIFKNKNNDSLFNLSLNVYPKSLKSAYIIKTLAFKNE